MYVSDYGYAASPENWTTRLSDYDNDTNRNNNWMYMKLYEYTLIVPSQYSNRIFIIHGGGSLTSSYGDATYEWSVRPVFYLNANVNIDDGTGTLSDPYRLSVN